MPVGRPSIAFVDVELRGRATREGGDKPSMGWCGRSVRHGRSTVVRDARARRAGEETR